MKHTKQLFQEALDKLEKELKKGDHSAGPFGLDYDECGFFLRGSRDTLQWVLEMMD